MTQGNADPNDIHETAIVLSEHPTASKPFVRMVNGLLADTSAGNKFNAKPAVARERETVKPLARVTRGDGE